LLLIVTAAALVLAALALFLKRRHHRQRAALPTGTLVAADNLEQPCPVLFSKRYGLKGKPDAILRTPTGLAPIERKRSRSPRRPHDSDVIQAAAYCLLIEDNYGETPLFMRIHYADTWFDVPFTDQHRQWVLQVSERLRAARTRDTCGRSHNMPAKCRSCAQRPNCNQAL
jgi:CRISPR-associated exonuclease Cas4